MSKMLAATITDDTGSLIDIDNGAGDALSFSVDASSVYVWEYQLCYQSEATTTGVSLSMSGPATPDLYLVHVQQTLNAAIGRPGSQNTYNEDTTTVSINTIDADSPARLDGLIVTTGAGTMMGRFSTEAADAPNYTKIMAGSALTFRKIQTSNGDAVTTSDQTTTSTTLADVTDLGLTLAANRTYKFRFYVAYQSANLGVGPELALTCPTGAEFSALLRVGYGPGGGTTYDRFALLNASGVGYVAGSVAVVDVDYLALIEGVIKTSSTAGDLQVQVATEVASNTITVRSGSCGYYELIEVQEFPATQAAALAAHGVTWDGLWLLDETTGDMLDRIGAVDLTPAGTLTRGYGSGYYDAGGTEKTGARLTVAGTNRIGDAASSASYDLGAADSLLGMIFYEDESEATAAARNFVGKYQVGTNPYWACMRQGSASNYNVVMQARDASTSAIASIAPGPTTGHAGLGPFVIIFRVDRATDLVEVCTPLGYASASIASVGSLSNAILMTVGNIAGAIGGVLGVGTALYLTITDAEGHDLEALRDLVWKGP